MIGIIIPSSLIINHFTILTRIYYRVNYKGNIQNFENLIEKSELFEYQKYCNYRTFMGEGYNISGADNYIDREFIESLKLQIDKDKDKFHIAPSYRRNFIYSFEVSNESLIYLTYNNNSVIKAEYSNYTEIFTADLDYYENNTLFWAGHWYLNFTQIPFALNMSTTIILSNIIIVKMSLEYDFGSENLMIEQYLIFNSNFQIMFVYIPISAHSTA
ncbi:hypothetical protein LCGC14_0578770 [marine sediment metagenome]|uniref:Uncharacterized protein n=1 Tax=marine sediment metagenome TaxID=412755 RepID=A0A0F9S0R3_9ZZZZ